MEKPLIESWINEAKKDENADKCGMYLTHIGVVRKTPERKVRENADIMDEVSFLDFSYDSEKVKNAVSKVENFPGIYYVRVWLNFGRLKVGDDIMQILIGGDIRPNVINALEYLLSEIKGNCVKENEIFE